MRELDNLPLVGSTDDVKNADSLEYWRCVFGGVWGPVELTEIGGNNISGSLHSRSVNDLTFNQITFGNQLFECVQGNAIHRDEPFYSLTFPSEGAAECFVGESRMRLVPHYAYLINVNLSAKLRVEHHYSTFNIQIPISKLEHRLGRSVSIVPRSIIQADLIYHLMQRLIVELNRNADQLEDSTAGFLSNQMLDTVAFFLSTGNNMSEDTLAVRSVRARVLAYLDANFRDPLLTPLAIARGCGISRSYLYKVFASGPSVMEHLRRRRLEAARKMLGLRREKITMTTVAMICGFSSSSEFSRLFKKQFGIKPSEL